MQPHSIFINRLEETRPTCSGIKLRIGSEKRQAASRAVVRARQVVVIEPAAKRGLRSVVSQDLKLCGRELLLPLRFRQNNFVVSLRALLLESPRILRIGARSSSAKCECPEN